MYNLQYDYIDFSSIVRLTNLFSYISYFRVKIFTLILSHLKFITKNGWVIILLSIK